METLTKLAIAVVIFYVLFMRREGFALDAGVKTTRSELDPTFYYKKGIIRPEVRNTIVEAVNNGQACAANYPQEIYVPIPKVRAECKLPDDRKKLYVDVPDNLQICSTGKKTLSKNQNRQMFNELTTVRGSQYVMPMRDANGRILGDELDCYTQLYNTVEDTSRFDCGSLAAECRFNTQEALNTANVNANYVINETTIKPANEW